MSHRIILVMIVLQLLAAIAAGIEGQWGKVCYFAGAVILTIGLLIMKG